MKKVLIITLFTLVTIAISFSCKKDSSNVGTSVGGTTVDCSTVPNKAFAADVNPIIQSRCNISGCHASGSTNGPGALTNYAQIAGASSAIRTAIISGSMPKNSSLSSLQKNAIICWIDSGSPNN